MVHFRAGAITEHIVFVEFKSRSQPPGILFVFGKNQLASSNHTEFRIQDRKSVLLSCQIRRGRPLVSALQSRLPEDDAGQYCWNPNQGTYQVIPPILCQQSNC